jgi:predicted AlkP superfamily pyrophosphatase or phosphodiesterase
MTCAFPRSSVRLAVLAFVVAVATACAPQVRQPPPASFDSVLLVSLDGVHPDYLGRGDTPNLDRLAREGVRAEWMNPAYPSLTFPNHYTLVTGLRPDRHGIIHNTMQDEWLGRFWLSNRDAVGDGRWWGGEPVWVTAENAGMPTATLSWPGSEAPVQGVSPTRWNQFDAERPIDERIDTVAGWLTEPDTTRPRFATLYFEHPDSAGHDHGPYSQALRDAMRSVDAAIGDLRARLERAGAWDRTDIVIVSDHGMAEVPVGHVVATEDMADPSLAKLVMWGQVVGFAPHPGKETEAEAAVLGRHAHHECWRKQDIPPRWQYGTHPRIPPIVCQMDLGWDALPRERIARRPAQTRGSHGYDPAHPQMRAIFIAHGPSFRDGATLPAFDNVHVYPLLMRLLGLPPADNDGDPRVLAPALKTATTPAH